MNDGGPRAPQDRTQHRNLVVRTALERAHITQGVGERAGAAVQLHLTQISVPVTAANGEIGDQVVKIGLVHDDDAGMFESGLISERVIRVIAELIDGDIKAGRVEVLRLRCEGFDLDEILEMIEHGGRVIGDAALRRRQRREERNPHG